MPIKGVEKKIWKNKENIFSPYFQRITQPPKKVPRLKGVPCSPFTDRQSDYCGHPFRVLGIFPSSYHQGLLQ